MKENLNDKNIVKITENTTVEGLFEAIIGLRCKGKKVLIDNDMLLDKETIEKLISLGINVREIHFDGEVSYEITYRQGEFACIDYDIVNYYMQSTK